MKKSLLAVFLLLALLVPAAASAQLPAGYVDTMSGGQYTTDSRGRVIATSQSVSGGISSCSNLKTEGVPGIVSCIIGFFNYAVYLIMAFSVLYIVWGAFKLMKEDGREEGKNIVLYGIIGLFVMVSIWGLVNILDRTFGLSGGQAITPPQLVAPR